MRRSDGGEALLWDHEGRCLFLVWGGWFAVIWGRSLRLPPRGIRGPKRVRCGLIFSGCTPFGTIETKEIQADILNEEWTLPRLCAITTNHGQDLEGSVSWLVGPRSRHPRGGGGCSGGLQVFDSSA